MPVAEELGDRLRWCSMAAPVLFFLSGSGAAVLVFYISGGNGSMFFSYTRLCPNSKDTHGLSEVRPCPWVTVS
jgi:hypothetical protein